MPIILVEPQCFSGQQSNGCNVETVWQRRLIRQESMLSAMVDRRWKGNHTPPYPLLCVLMDVDMRTCHPATPTHTLIHEHSSVIR